MVVYKKTITAVMLALSLILFSGCASSSGKADTDLKDTKVKNEAYTQEKDKVHSEQNISEKIKEFIINGQQNKSEAEKIKWSKTFLDKVDIESLHKQYLADGGNTDDLESFAGYITLKASIPNDWQELFKKDLYEAYGEKVVRIEPLEGDLYQAYIIKNGSEVPYVVVSSRTGYYHG